jgi:hypothetical protein
MPDTSMSAPWKIPANEEYQKVINIIMNLATASLVLPVVFLQNFASSGGKKTAAELGWRVQWGWKLLVLAVAFGLVFHWASAKYVKLVKGAPPEHEFFFEKTFETIRDVCVVLVCVCFAGGIALLVWFFYQNIFGAS